MTSKVKCPYCQTELNEDEEIGDCYCPNIKCEETTCLSGSKMLWQALIQAKQDLEIATKAMNQIMSMGAKNNICYHLKAKTVKSILGNALKQIEHKDEK